MLLSMREIDNIVDKGFSDVELTANNNIEDVIGSRFTDTICGVKYAFVIMDIIIRDNTKYARLAFLDRTKFIEEQYELDEIRCLSRIINDRNKDVDLDIKLYEHQAAEKIIKAYKTHNIELYHMEAIEICRLFKQEFCDYKEYCILMTGFTNDKLIRITHSYVIDSIIKAIDVKRENL